MVENWKLPEESEHLNSERDNFDAVVYHWNKNNFSNSNILINFIYIIFIHIHRILIFYSCFSNNSCFRVTLKNSFT